MKFSKRIRILAFILILFLSISDRVSAKVTWPSGPGVSSDGAIIMDAATGAVLFSKNINKEMYPASITKIMTVLLVLENCSMDQVVTFSRDAVFNIEFGSNHIGMTVDEQITVEQALYGICLESANEVCNGVGELIAGSQEKFVDMMNARAKELGCKHTHFMNANGLHDKQHYSSPYDMALIARECLKHPEFKKIAGTKSYQLPPTNKTSEVRYLNNQHKMFPGKKYEYDGFECGKTGFTDQALNTLVSIAKRDNLELICVTMHGNQTHYPDTTALLNYGFKHYKDVAISSMDENLKNNYYAENESVLKDFLGSSKDFTFEYDKSAVLTLPDTASFSDYVPKLSDPKTEGDTLSANIKYYYGEDIMGTIPVTLTKKEAVAAASPGKQTTEEGNPPLIFTILKILLIVVIVVVIGFIILYLYAKNEVKKRRQRRRRQYEDDEYEDHYRRRRYEDRYRRR